MKLRQTLKMIRERARRLPRPLRIAAGTLLVFLGFLGFLPVLGFWMTPVGLVILAIDIPIVKRWIHRAVTAFNQWRRKRRSK